MKDLSKTGIAIQFLLVVGVLIVIVGFALLYHDYQSSAASHREVMRARGQTLLDSLTAGISAQGRMGRYQPERLSAIFEGLVYTPDILGIVLSTQEGVVISSGGEAPNPMEAVPESPRWQENRLTMVCEPLLLGQGPGRGSGFGVNRGRRPGWRGRPENDNEWKPFPRGPYFLVATLDTTAMRDKIHKEQIRFAVSTGVMLIAVLLGALFLLAWIRQRNLQVALLIAQERTTQQEHLTQLGAGFAHETKNPLGIVRGQAQLIADSSDSQENTVRAAMIVDEIDRTVRQVNSFLSLARPKEATLTAINLDRFLEKFLPLIEEEAREKNITLTSPASGITIYADEDLLRRALLNLMINAFRACRSEDKIQLIAERNGSSVSLTVTDTGCGIAPEDLSRVTEPYFTHFDGGSGLGLSLVKQIALAHEWKLHITSQQGKGTRVSLDKIKEVTPNHA